MRTVNRRLLVVLLVLCGSVGLGAYWWHGVQIRRHAIVYLREAERAKEAGDVPTALANFDRYLQFRPNDAEAMAELGLLLADGRQNSRAFDLLEKSLRLEPGREELRRRLVQVSLELRRFTDAQEHLEQYLLKTSPQDPELLTMFGRCQEELGDYQAAVNSFEAAVRFDPQRLDAYARLAGVLRQKLERAKEADEWMEKMVAANPASARGFALHASYLRNTRPVTAGGTATTESQEKRLAAAYDCAVRAVKLEPQNKEALLLATACAADRKLYDEARKDAEQLLALDPRFVPAYAALADLETRRGKRPEAIAWLQRGLEQLPGHGDLLWQLADLQLDEGQLEEAEKIEASLAAAGYPEAWIGYLQGRAAMARQQWLPASRTLERIRSGLRSQSALSKQTDFYLGTCYGYLGDVDQQLVAYRRAIAADPFWLPPRQGVVAALLRLNRIDEAQEELQHIVQLGGPAASWIELARLEIGKNQQRSRSERKWEPAQQALNQAEKADPNAVAVPLLRGEILLAQDRFAEAEKLVQAARDKFPRRIELRVALAALAEQQRDWPRATSLLDQAAKDLGDSVALRIARAELLRRQSGRDMDAELRKLGEHTENLPAAELPRLFGSLATARFQLTSLAKRKGDAAQVRQDAEEVRRLCQKWSATDPANLQPWMLLFDLALVTEDPAGLEAALEQVERLTGRDALWKFGQAVQHTLQAIRASADTAAKLFQQAQDALAEVRSARPSWPRAWDLAARVYERQGAVAAAVEAYQRAMDLGERSPAILERAVRLLTQEGRYQDADRLLRRVVEPQAPLSGELGRLASELSLRLEDWERAMDLARQVAAGSQNWADHLWLGYVLSVPTPAKDALSPADTAKRHEEAERELRQAITLAPHRAAPWVALIQLLQQLGQTEKARQALAEAEQKIAPQEAPAALAQCLESLGERERAAEKYRQALAAAPKDAGIARRAAEFYLRTNQPEQAQAQLQRILGGPLTAEPADLAWARRTQAGILGLSRRYDRLGEGLKLIDANLAAANPSLDDWRTKSLLLATSPRAQDRDQAAQILEKQVLAKQREPRAEDRFRLGQIYLARRDWTRARPHLRGALASAPNELPYLGAYVAACLAHDETSEAEVWLRPLERLAPDDLGTLRLRTEVLLRRGEVDQALAAVRDWTSREDKPDRREARIGAAAAILADLNMAVDRSKQETGAEKLTRETETLFRESMKQHPEHGAALAQFLARQGRLDEALTVLETVWKTCKPEVLGVVLNALSRAAPQQLERADRLLKEALQTHGRPLPLLMTQAEFRTIQQRHAEAESLYREALKKAPSRISILNNLALCLALQGNDLPEALQLIDRAIALDGPNANLLDSRAMVLLAQRQLPEALATIREALAEAPAAVGYFHQARILYEMGHMQPARESLRQAEQLGLRQPSLHPVEHDEYAKLKVLLGGSERK